jgi:adenylate kinase family enzyme
MSAVMITGWSGAGKSTIAAELVRRGLAAVDADGDPLLARYVDPDGTVVPSLAEPDLDWLARHSWQWDKARLDELIRAAAPQTLHVCGNADNQLDLAGRFTHVVLLEIDEPTMLSRLDEPGRANDFGRTGDARDVLRRWLPGYQRRVRDSGAICIDARQPLDQVAGEILARTQAG